MLRRGLGGQAGDVAGPVLAGAEEERADDDARRAAGGAAIVCRRDRRLGEFHVRRFHDVVSLVEARTELAGDFLEQIIALRPPGAVIDDDDAGFHGYVDCHSDLTRRHEATKDTKYSK